MGYPPKKLYIKNYSVELTQGVQTLSKAIPKWLVGASAYLKWRHFDKYVPILYFCQMLTMECLYQKDFVRNQSGI